MILRFKKKILKPKQSKEVLEENSASHTYMKVTLLNRNCTDTEDVFMVIRASTRDSGKWMRDMDLVLSTTFQEKLFIKDTGTRVNTLEKKNQQTCDPKQS
jgi:hypothetical protein